MRLINANRIPYSWQIDEDGQAHDGIALESVINKMPSFEAVPTECIENIIKQLQKLKIETLNIGNISIAKYRAFDQAIQVIEDEVKQYQ